MKKFAKVILIIMLCCTLLSFSACHDKPNANQGGTTGNQQQPNNNQQEQTVTSMKITIGDKTFTASLYDTEAAQAFAKMLPITLNMSELNGNEKYYYMQTSLPTDAERVGNISAGDIMLYGSDCIVLFYKSFSTSYSYTKIGKINDIIGLIEAVGNNSVTVTFSV